MPDQPPAVTAGMSAERIEEIRTRTSMDVGLRWVEGPKATTDRIALLNEVERLRALVTKISQERAEAQQCADVYGQYAYEAERGAR